MENNIEIYFDDLTPKKQAEILAKLGENGNYDVFPIATIPIGEDEPGHDGEDANPIKPDMAEVNCAGCANRSESGDRRKDDCDRRGCNFCMPIFKIENKIEDIWYDVPLDRSDFWEAMVIMHIMGELEKNSKITIPFHSYDERVRIACEIVFEWTHVSASGSYDIEGSPVDFSERRLLEKFSINGVSSDATTN